MRIKSRSFLQGWVSKGWAWIGFLFFRVLRDKNINRRFSFRIEVRMLFSRIFLDPPLRLRRFFGFQGINNGELILVYV